MSSPLDTDVRRRPRRLWAQPPRAHAETPHVTGIIDGQTQATALDGREIAGKRLASQQVIGEQADQFRVHAIGHRAQELSQHGQRQGRHGVRAVC